MILANLLTHPLRKARKKISFAIKYKKAVREMNFQESDILIVSYMRSGTNWMRMILYQLLTEGNGEINQIEDVCPDIMRMFEDDEKFVFNTNPRLMQAHLRYKHLPKKFNGKVIYMLRNGLDVSVSQHMYYKNNFDNSITFEESFDKYFLKNKNFSWFKHVDNWLENKKKKKVLYVKYEDLKRNNYNEIKRVATFCDLKFNDEIYDKVFHKTSLKYMKENKSVFGKFEIIRKGDIGDGNQINTLLIDQYNTMMMKKLVKHNIMKEYLQEDK